MNDIGTVISQLNAAIVGHNTAALAGSETGGNTVVADLVAVNAGNPAVATGTALDVSPITQTSIGTDIGTIVDTDIVLDVL
jgi:hypothetical protein